MNDQFGVTSYAYWMKGTGNMIDYLVLTKEITVFQALEIKKNLELPVISREEAGTKKYTSSGISSLKIWLNLDKILEEPEICNCTLSAKVDGKRFYQNGKYDVEKTLATLSRILNDEGLSEIRWRLQNIAFKMEIASAYATKYVELMNNGYSLKGIGAVKTADDKKKPTKLQYKSDSIFLQIEADKLDNTVSMQLRLAKRKINDMVRGNKYPVEDRDFSNYDSVLEELEKKLWICYLGRIAGTADYYSFKEAEKIIESSEKKPVEKENMYSVLKGIAVYKGIEDYLGHTQDADKKYDFMKCIRTQKTAKTYIKMLQDDLGINPVNISRRDAKELGIGKLENLLSYEEMVTIETDKEKLRDELIASMTPVAEINQNQKENCIQEERDTGDNWAFDLWDFSGEEAPF